MLHRDNDYHFSQRLRLQWSRFLALFPDKGSFIFTEIVKILACESKRNNCFLRYKCTPEKCFVKHNFFPIGSFFTCRRSGHQLNIAGHVISCVIYGSHFVSLSHRRKRFSYAFVYAWYAFEFSFCRTHLSALSHSLTYPKYCIFLVRIRVLRSWMLVGNYFNSFASSIFVCA